MVSIDVDDVDLLDMEDQIHMTITGTVCAVIFGAVYWFFSAREALIAEEIGSSDMDLDANIYKKEDWTTPRTGVVCLVVAYIVYVLRLINHLYFDQIEAMLRKMTGLKSGEEEPSRQRIQLGPHDSYRTLIFSVLSCTVTLAFIWLIKIAPFEKLYKRTPLHKLVKILFNSPDLDLEEDDRITKGNPEQTARHQQILNTCIELEKRMCRLEQCLAPLTRSLQTLSEVVESRNEEHVVDLPAAAAGDHLDLTATYRLDDSSLKRYSGAQVADHLNSKVGDHLDSKVTDLLDFQDPIDFQVTDPPDAHVTSTLQSHI